MGNYTALTRLARLDRPDYRRPPQRQENEPGEEIITPFQCPSCEQRYPYLADCPSCQVPCVDLRNTIVLTRHGDFVAVSSDTQEALGAALGALAGLSGTLVCLNWVNSRPGTFQIQGIPILGLVILATMIGAGVGGWLGGRWSRWRGARAIRGRARSDHQAAKALPLVTIAALDAHPAGQRVRIAGRVSLDNSIHGRFRVTDKSGSVLAQAGSRTCIVSDDPEVNRAGVLRAGVRVELVGTPVAATDPTNGYRGSPTWLFGDDDLAFVVVDNDQSSREGE